MSDFGIDPEIDRKLDRFSEDEFDKKKVISLDRYRANLMTRKYKEALQKILEEAKKLTW